MGFEVPLLGTLIAYCAATAAGLAFFVFLVRRRRDTRRGPGPDDVGTRGSSGFGTGSGAAPRDACYSPSADARPDPSGEPESAQRG